MSKPRWQRAVISAAGPAVNLVFPILLLTVYFVAIGVPYAVFEDKPVVVTAVPANSTSAAAGLHAGRQSGRPERRAESRLDRGHQDRQHRRTKYQPLHGSRKCQREAHTGDSRPHEGHRATRASFGFFADQAGSGGCRGRNAGRASGFERRRRDRGGRWSADSVVGTIHRARARGRRAGRCRWNVERNGQPIALGGDAAARQQ